MIKRFLLAGMLATALIGCSKENEVLTENTLSTSGEVESRNITYNTTSDDQGWKNGRWFTFWKNNSNGYAQISWPTSNAGNFQVRWDYADNIVIGMGWKPGSSQAIGYNVGRLEGQYDFVGIYGWTRNPLIEYYVAEFGGGSLGSTGVNTVNADGHTYSFGRNQQVNKPSIEGDKTFWQYIDKWGGARTGVNSKVTMSTHINNWKNKGGKGFGSFDYQVLAIEVFNGASGKNGWFNATVWRTN